MNRSTRIALGALLILSLSSCAGPGAAPVSDEDAAALATLAEVAGPTSNVDPAAITRTEKRSENWLTTSMRPVGATSSSSRSMIGRSSVSRHSSTTV